MIIYKHNCLDEYKNKYIKFDFMKEGNPMEKRIIEKMVKAMNFEKNEVVFINFWGTADELSYLYDFENAMKNEGVTVKALAITDEFILEEVGGKEAPLPESWFDRYDEAESVVDIISRPPGMPPQGLAKEKIPLFGEFLRGIFKKASSKKKFIQVTMPSRTNAMMAGMDYEKYRDRIIKALDIDYDELRKNCEKKISEYRGDKRIIKTGKNCILTMETTGRKWYIDAGDGAFPCGEIFIAPLEDKSNGSIFFETFAAEGVGVFKNVTLFVEAGRVVSSDCDKFNEFLKTLPEGGNVVAELGIGMNPNVDCIEGDSALDENALGTFHIAIGMNHLFGGVNECPFHMDFVTTGEIL